MKKILPINEIEINGQVHKINYRRSTEQDKWQIEKLIYNNFGDRSDYNIMDDVENGKFLCAILDETKVIAITGILYKDPRFNGHELGWTCIDENYRRHGIVTYMIYLEVKQAYTKSDIYCSCWAYGDNKSVNLHSAMETLGFEKVYNSVNYQADHFRWCKTHCIHYKPGCHCREDIYILRNENK